MRLERLTNRFRPSFGDQLVDKGSVPSPSPVEPSCLAHHSARTHQPNGAIRLHRDKQLVALAGFVGLSFAHFRCILGWF